MIDPRKIARSVLDPEFFNTHIFPLSWREPIVPSPHTNKWIKDLAQNSHVAILSARKHLKSVTVYAYLMWKILNSVNQDYECFYFSYNKELASHHTANIKKLISYNPYFKQCIDLTPAESILKYTWDNDNMITIRPQGITSFKRGLHPNEVICDDILADPSSELNLTVIDRINNIFFKEIMSLPKEPGSVKVVGTAQTQTDLFFQLKNKPKFKWGMYKAILHMSQKQVLWPQLFSYKRLMEIKNEELGEKAFNQEYMCSPVHSEKAYFKKDQIEMVINPGLGNLETLRTDNAVYLGWDIGKKRHPSHIAVFERVGDKLVQRLSIWLDGWDYSRQLVLVKDVCEEFSVDEGYWDATRGEYDTAFEQGEMPDVLKPMIFKKKTKFDMATTFEKLVNKKKIELIDDNRQTDQILCVNNDLDAVESPQGHGDSFWSIGMALYAAEYTKNIIDW